MSDDSRQVDSLAGNKLSPSTTVARIEQSNSGQKNISDTSEQAENVITITELVGQFGWWQFNIAAFYFIAYVLTTFNNLGISFHAAKTDYRCLQWNKLDNNQTIKVKR